ncbi:MAG TPA: zinc-dependent alcohol dehydrogenase family protein [Lactovum miscens]|uniref:zinc-dependent alcohol dehydrogenase family protein n=1 Tax=Lactovum miscens TaxID=190387 RepID=UPI002ED81480
MKSAYFIKPGKVEIRNFSKPEIEESTDVIIKIVRACVCGSDLWWFRGITKREPGVIGHEAIGIIESIGNTVHNFKVGDFVIVPFTHGCGQCAICKAGFEANCPNATEAVSGGYQGEYYRAINADGALVKIPGKPSDYSENQLASLTTLSDVMPTGFHAAKAAGVKNKDTVVIFGDGGVGLCAVIGAKLLGAKRIIMMSRHSDRTALALEFGATDIIKERDEAAVKQVLLLTKGLGADAVLECAGTKSSVETAMQVARAGANIGRVGVPHEVDYNPYMTNLFFRNIGLTGGGASVSRWDKEILLNAVLNGEINPGKVFTHTYELDDVEQAYKDMDERRTIKSLLRISEG